MRFLEHLIISQFLLGLIQIHGQITLQLLIRQQVEVGVTQLPAYGLLVVDLDV